MPEWRILLCYIWLLLFGYHCFIFVIKLILYSKNLLNHWLYSYGMTSDPTTNHKFRQEQKELLTMEENSGRGDQTNDKMLQLVCPSVNLMQLVEVKPSNPINKPHPRSGHRAVATESDLWIWGGYFPRVDDHHPERMFKELWRYNFALRQWTLEQTTGDGPTLTLASHSMCLVRNLLLVFGGTGYPFGQHSSNDLFALDLKQRHWKRCQLLNEPPQQVYGASMVVDGDHLYVLCGTNSWNYNSDVYEIHLPTLTSTHIGRSFPEPEEPMDSGRYRQEAILHEKQIFVFGGGGVSGISFSLKILPVFDIATRTWSFVHTHADPIHNYPAARKFHSIFRFRHNQIVLFGGAYFNMNESRHIIVDNRLWTFDFDRLEWAVLPSLTMPRTTYFHAAAMNNRGEIWSHGGVVEELPPSNNPGARSNRNQEARISTLYKMHIDVPSLHELAWNYLLNNLRDRTCLLTKPQLMSQLHIPTRFTDRIH